MTKINISILKALAIVAVLFFIAIVIFFDTRYLHAAIIGFFSSSLVVLSSLKAYANMVNTRVEHNVITLDDSKDVIDQLEDPYDLYSEDIVADEPEEADVAKKPKDNRSLFQILKDTKASLSPYRISAYIMLILGFLYLNRHGLLHIPTYIVALGIPPIVIVFVLLKEKE